MSTKYEIERISTAKVADRLLSVDVARTAFNVGSEAPNPMREKLLFLGWCFIRLNRIVPPARVKSGNYSYDYSAVSSASYIISHAGRVI